MTHKQLHAKKLFGFSSFFTHQRPSLIRSCVCYIIALILFSMNVECTHKWLTSFTFEKKILHWKCRNFNLQLLYKFYFHSAKKTRVSFIVKWQLNRNFIRLPKDIVNPSDLYLWARNLHPFQNCNNFCGLLTYSQKKIYFLLFFVLRMWKILIMFMMRHN